ncbi:MAG TPA: PHP domain-containing protein, partial [Clostridia bacterium]|nr:PHP domain-containing protein [Clostridia bacterium]
MSYTELHARSAFSFLEGASQPEQLAEVCAKSGMASMALLDGNGVYGAARFHLAAKKLGIRAHIGSELTLNFPPQRHRDTEKTRNSSSVSLRPGGEEARLPVLITSRAGYQNLCRLVTRMKLRVPKHTKPGECATIPGELAAYAEGLLCLTGDENGPLALALERGGVDEARLALQELAGIFGKENVYVELQRHYNRRQEARNQAAVSLARSMGLPVVATNGVQHALPEQRKILDVFTCIRNHTTLNQAGRLLALNNERHVKTPEEMSRLFADLPEAIANTSEVASRLEFTLADLGYEFPRYPVPEGESMMSFLRKRTAEGERARYGRKDRALQERAHRQIER